MKENQNKFYYVIRTNDYAEQRIIGKHFNYNDAYNQLKRCNRRDPYAGFYYRVQRLSKDLYIGMESSTGEIWA